MKIKYKIKQNWVTVAGIIRKNPAVLLPFIYVAFFELLILELAFFSSMKPMSAITAPIIRKLIGEEFLHYPGSVYVVPQLFHYIDMAVYIFISVYMMAISVNMFKDIMAGLPIKMSAAARKASKKYAAFVFFGALMIALTIIAKKIDMLILKKLINMAGSGLSYKTIVNAYLLLLPLSVFIINAVLQTFTIVTVPVIVLQDMPFLKALRKSVSLGSRNFFTLFGLIFVPFLAYLPVIILKSRATELSARTFPELAILLTAGGIVVSVLVDSFMILCASQFLADKDKAV